MADKPEKEAAAPKRIAVVNADGQFGTIDAKYADEITKSGGRILGQKEIAERAEQERYDALPTVNKVAGAVQAATGYIAGPVAALGAGAASPFQSHRAAAHGVAEGVTMGGADVAGKYAAEALGGKEAGQRYVQATDDIKTASPIAHGVGEVAGMTAGALGGAAAGPAGLLGAAGEAVEGGVAAGARALGYRGATALGRAGVAAAEIGARGALEGGLQSGIQYATDAQLHDVPMTTDKLFAAVGTGSLYGGAGGAALGASGSLVKSGFNAARGGLARALSPARAAEVPALAEAAAPNHVPFIDADAGLRGAPEKAESPFTFGAEHRPMTLRPDVAQRGKLPLEEPFSFGKRVGIDPDAGLRDPIGKSGSPFKFDAPSDDLTSRLHDLKRGGHMVPISELRAQYAAEGVTGDAFEQMLRKADREGLIRLNNANDPALMSAAERDASFRLSDRERNIAWVSANEAPAPGGVSLIDMARSERAATSGKPVFRTEYDVTMNPDAGIAKRGARGKFQGPVEATDALKPSSAKNVPRDVIVRDGVEAAEMGAAQRPIQIPKAALEAVAEGRPIPVTLESRMRNLSNEMAADALGATKVQQRNALEYVGPNAKAAVGEYVNRIGIAKAADGQGLVGGAIKAGMSGRADELLVAIQADKGGRIATGLSEAVKGTPARVNVDGLLGQADGIYRDMLRDPTRIAGAEAFRNRVTLELSALENAQKIAADRTIDAAEAFYTRSAMAKQAYELGKASGSAGDAYKQFLRQMDRTTVEAIDKAAEAAGKGSAGDAIRHWKREWQIASAAEEMALGGAERVSGNNTFGIRESIGAAAGLATGNILGAGVTLLAGKIARERGSAVAAYGLAQLVERGTLTRLVSKMDDQITAASKGLIAPPAKGLAKGADKMPPTKSLAKAALLKVAEYQSDPEGYVDRASRQAEGLAAHSPEIADALVARQVKAAQFLASKVPVSPDPDPLDPHKAPKLTPNEQSELGRYAWYVEKPDRFFKEVARGRITFEGAETAQALMPDAFAQLQQQTLDAISTQMARGNTLPFRQRQLLGVLLDVAATPSQRPEHARFLQKNVEPLPTNDPKPTAASGGMGGIPKLATSSYDRLEAGGPGR